MLAKVLLDFVILLNILMPGKYNCARLTFSDQILLSNFPKILTKIQFRGLIKHARIQYNPFMPELICENWTFFDMTPNGVTGHDSVGGGVSINVAKYPFQFMEAASLSINRPIFEHVSHLNPPVHALRNMLLYKNSANFCKTSKGMYRGVNNEILAHCLHICLHSVHLHILKWVFHQKFTTEKLAPPPT